jgi:hypothetical protein
MGIEDRTIVIEKIERSSLCVSNAERHQARRASSFFWCRS